MAERKTSPQAAGIDARAVELGTIAGTDRPRSRPADDDASSRRALFSPAGGLSVRSGSDGQE